MLLQAKLCVGMCIYVYVCVYVCLRSTVHGDFAVIDTHVKTITKNILTFGLGLPGTFK